MAAHLQAGCSTAAVVVLSLLAASPVVAANSAEILGGEEPHTVTFTRQSDLTLSGKLPVIVRNNSDDAAELRLRFYPADGSSPIRLPGGATAPVVLLGEEGKPASTPPTVGAHRVREVVLQFQLGKDAALTDADGEISAGLRLGGAKGSPAVAHVVAAGGAFPNVTFQPTTITLRTTSPAPWEAAPSVDERVRLVGSGVPALFEDGTATTVSSTRIVDSDGHEVHVFLEDLKRESELVASARIKATGELEAGEYQGTLALTPLSSAAPSLTATVQAKDHFGWPLATVLAGALVAFLVLLGTGVNRRKALLRIQLRAVLERYRKEREGLGAMRFDQPAVIWALEDLGDPSTWYERKWDAIPGLDGARGIWSNIAYARSETDLEEDAELVAAVQARVARWLQALGPAKRLVELDQFDDRRLPYGGKMWSSTQTCKDTQLLLRLADEEPASDEAAQQLVDRLRRQARWHHAFAEVWDLWVHLGKHMDANPPSYTDAQRIEFVELKLDELDKSAAEANRTAEVQREKERELAGRLDVIQKLRKAGHAPATDDEPRQFELASMSADEAYRNFLRHTPEPLVARAEDKPNRREAYAGVVRRDIAWTLVIALLTAIAYMAPLYTDTWGSYADYATAFAAGFLGKVGIQWAAMPVLQSLRLRAKRTSAPTGDAASEPVAPAAPIAPRL